eukprot:TRINITY_DN2438_c0_g1_i1.p1 TRINITY_DN2438_c0_g1~~TRINITY_DN2438_c0_g1_i1.p1  ORF type:complete len:249 (+),score=32.62 TRINITY_DN2438_c0_g1_i1:533-1279(+)
METLILPAEDQFARKQTRRNYCNRKNYNANFLFPPNPKSKGSEPFYQSPLKQSQNGSSILSFPPVLRKPYRSLKPNSSATYSSCCSPSEYFPQSFPGRPGNTYLPKYDARNLQTDQKSKTFASKKRTGSDCKYTEKGGCRAPTTIPKTLSKSEPKIRNKNCISISSRENWAGPAYSNSPPPSSLPFPKFSIRERRSVSLDLPPENNEFSEVLSKSVSLPASPTREDFTLDVVSATRNLRRILNLDPDN